MLRDEVREQARRLASRSASPLIGGVILGMVVLACSTSHLVPPTNAIATPVSAPPSPRGLAARSEPAVPIEAVQPAIERMIAPEVGGSPLKILALAGPVRGWLAVAVSPPYREFPTVVLFRSRPDGSWSRVFEALTPGVQPQRSNLLDLHAKGQAFDYTIDEGSRNTPDVVAKVLSVSTRRDVVTIAHAYFFHGHPAGPESYFVDRTATYELARRLFHGQYDEYPRTECTMFDVPALRRIDFASVGNRLLLTAQTENGQTWVIGWDGVDDRGLLTGKTVDAK